MILFGRTLDWGDWLLLSLMALGLTMAVLTGLGIVGPG